MSGNLYVTEISELRYRTSGIGEERARSLYESDTTMLGQNRAHSRRVRV